MLSLQAAVVALSLSVAAGPTCSGETVLLDFYADWCGPCQQMHPVVDRLAAMGYPVRKVNFDSQRALAANYGVDRLPSFVMLVDGREVDRVVGSTSLGRLEQMCRLAGGRPSGRSPDPAGPATAAGTAASQDEAPYARGGRPGEALAQAAMSEQDLIAATVRLRIEDAGGHSCGSGTIIDARRGEALILTCGHIFRDSKGKGRIEVDLFGPTPAENIPGRLLTYDLEEDIGLLAIRTPGPVVSAPVAPAGYRVSQGDWVINVGCNNGDQPTVRYSRVTSLNKFLGPANLEVGGLPVQGRSGGGLFSRQGLVIGVCNAADPTDNEGLYAALELIHGQLDRAELSCIYRSVNEADQGEAPLVAISPPPMPKQMPRAARGGQLTEVAAGSSDLDSASTVGARFEQLRPEEQAALEEIRRHKAAGSEVICVIRSRAAPETPSEILVLDDASAAFLQQLAAEAKAADGPRLTSLEVRNNGPSRVGPSPANSCHRSDWQPHWLEPATPAR